MTTDPSRRGKLLRALAAAIGAAALAAALCATPSAASAADPAAPAASLADRDASRAAVVVPGADPAPATTTKPPAGLAAAKNAVDIRIKLRLRSLSDLKLAVTNAADLTGAHKSTLTDLLDSDISGLTALKTKTDAETTVAAVRADGKQMIVGYRVYMLVTPQVRFTIASDRQTAIIGKLTGIQSKLSSIASQLAGQGKDVSQEQAELADMQAKLSAATSALDGRATTLLAVQPSPDASAMKAAVGPVRSAVRAARTDLKSAIVDARAARKGLKSLAG